MNALTFEVYAQMRDLFETLRYDAAVRAIVLTGAGDNFCSGGDVHQIIGKLLERDMKAHLDFTRMTGAVVANMRLLDKPIIAALNGTTAGAGAVIALASDLRLASERAKIAFLFGKVGLAGADMGAAYLLPRVVGLGRATELLLLGEPVSAARAEEIGLVTQVAEDDLLAGETSALARRLADGPAAAYATTKVLLTREQDVDLGSAIELDAACANVATALGAAGGEPEDLVSMQIFVTEIDEYTSRREEVGAAWRRHFGPHYPAAGLFGVTRLVDPAAKVELMAIAVVPT